MERWLDCTNQLRSYQFTLFTLGELRGGTLRDGTSFTGTASLNSGSIVRQDLRESSPGISGWAGFYAAIFQVNNFIYQVEKADYLVAADKSYYLGQAYGLRAFYYFQLYRTYGRVPLAKEPKVAISYANYGPRCLFATYRNRKRDFRLY